MPRNPRPTLPTPTLPQGVLFVCVVVFAVVTEIQYGQFSNHHRKMSKSSPARKRADSATGEVISELRDNSKEKAAKILKDVLPAKIAQYHAWLTTMPEFNLSSPHEVSPDLAPLAELAKKDNAAAKAGGVLSAAAASSAGPDAAAAAAAAAAAGGKSPAGSPSSASRAKKRKVGPSAASAASAASSSSSPAAPSVMVPCNAKVSHLIDIMKKEVTANIEDLGVVKLWIQLLVPRIEDGNNFGVGVQEELISELSRVEDSAFNVLDQTTKYFSTRAKLVSKFKKYPHILDYRQAIIEADQMEYTSTRLSLVDLRNNLTILHDQITKNADKIEQPRGATGSVSMY